jgi:carbon monoxide dehydrogenase subunit G
MKLNAREDIELPIAEVWSFLTDFEVFERAAMRRGAEVQRTGATAGALAWSVSFRFRGKQRTVAVRQTRQDAPGALAFAFEGRQVAGTVTLELMELGPRRTRMMVSTEARPLTLAARLFLQSLKLARSRVVKRYQTRVAQLATMIEARGRGQKAGF